MLAGDCLAYWSKASSFPTPLRNPRSGLASRRETKTCGTWPKAWKWGCRHQICGMSLFLGSLWKPLWQSCMGTNYCTLLGTEESRVDALLLAQWVSIGCNNASNSISSCGDTLPLHFLWPRLCSCGVGEELTYGSHCLKPQEKSLSLYDKWLGHCVCDSYCRKDRCLTN